MIRVRRKLQGVREFLVYGRQRDRRSGAGRRLFSAVSEIEHGVVLGDRPEFWPLVGHVASSGSTFSR